MEYNGEEIKDCPFCDNSWGAPQPEISDGKRFSFGCMNPHCGASAGWRDTESEALASWNKRA